MDGFDEFKIVERSVRERMSSFVVEVAILESHSNNGRNGFSSELLHFYFSLLKFLLRPTLLVPLPVGATHAAVDAGFVPNDLQLMAKLDPSFGERDMDGMPENSQPEQKQGQEDDLAIGGGERWHWWPGGSVFRMLVPMQKVASIIGRKGEYKCVKRQELALRFLMVLQELQKELSGLLLV